MTNSIGDLTPSERKEVFKDYLAYYDLVWQHGNVKVCKDRQVTEKARRVLLSETDPVERFTTFDFYPTAFECVSVGVRDCRSVFNVFIKAAEVLETLCVNLFLFPWKKEIKTIKTFTGPFVYCIQPVLPKNVVRSILESIGYRPESDTEYRLAPGANHDKAKAMGFELFLARVECEYLLEAMGQSAHAECLEILQRRAGSLSHRESHATAENEPGSESSRPGKDSIGLVVDEDLPVPDVFLPDESVVVAQAQEEPLEGSIKLIGEPERHEPLRLEAEAPAVAGIPEPSGRHHAGSFMNDDRSMLEMQENYPDLAIRKNYIFRKNRGGSYPTPGTKARGRLGDDADIVPSRSYAQVHTHHTHAPTSDLSGPQSFSVHTESLMPPGPMGQIIKPLPKVSRTDDILDPQPLMVSSGQASLIQYRDTATQSAVHRPGQQGSTNPPDLQELNNRLSQLNLDEPLKYPIEETAQVQPPPCAGCHDHHRPGAVTAVAPPPGSPQDNSHQPILCSPSPLPVCSISGCSSCTSLDEVHHGLRAGEDTIKEPPGSIYMPPSPLGMCGPPLEPSSGHMAAAAPSLLGQPGMEGRGSGQQPEDDLLKTYVLVEHEKTKRSDTSD